ncbi:hypothetical protein GO621_18625 [Mucilaginibacter sp. HMF7410]|uniref:Uncharacterized protein n=2 Tax=Mucilaginibacter arboris TaxID=2682090 RepID=A0A7K1T1W2_9SPHI|nr:hypothetical protein [Mucilaginibacter arboris]
MKYKILYTIIATLALTSCKNQSSRNNLSNISLKSNNIHHHPSDVLPFLDTTIILRSIKYSQLSNRDISEKEAKEFLYMYFKSKGVINRNDLKGKLSNDEEKICVEYDTIYKIHTNKFSGAIISYWLGPAELNGHCFQPNKAIIIASNNNYKIAGEQFIPNSFSIDSCLTSNIYGYDYECGGRGTLRHFKVTLE